MKNNFTASGEVFDWISGFINLERGQTPKSFRLDRMEALMDIAGHPQKCAPSIHIAGSKGKGSVTGMLTAILCAAGYRAARYMSPHVTDIRERICLGDSFFNEKIYCAAGNKLRQIVEKQFPALANPLFCPDNPDGCEPTFWELLTLLFFLCAKEAECDVMVVETGMGRRLDSTNVLDPLVSVITLIELEHTAFLGNTIEAIAGEKAGIIKKDKPLILAEQKKEALNVFKKKAQEMNSQLFYFPEIAELTDLNITPCGTDFTLSIANCPLPPARFSLPIPGKVQAQNAALAIAAVKTAFPQIDQEAISNGLKNLKIPGRFEKIQNKDSPDIDSFTPFIIDGAHTPESLTLCLETFCSLYGDGGILIFGCGADKDAAAMAKIACSYFSKIIITTPGNFKISNPQKIYEIFRQITGEEKTILIADTCEAVKQAQEIAHRKKLPVLGTGSFYLVSEIRNFFYKGTSKN